MTREETTKILAILKAAYPNSYRGMTKDEAKGTVAVWAAQFASMPANVVMIAVNKLISTQTFPPSIGEVKEKIRGLYWEAWHMLNANRTYGNLDEKTVAQLDEIMRICEPMRTRISIEPTLEELLDSYSGYLEGGSRESGVARIE